MKILWPYLKAPLRWAWSIVTAKAARSPALLTFAALFVGGAVFYHTSAVGRLLSLRMDYAWLLLLIFAIVVWLPLYWGRRRFENGSVSSQTISAAGFWLLCAFLSWLWILCWWSVDWPVWWCLVWLIFSLGFFYTGAMVFVGWSEIWRSLWMGHVAGLVKMKVRRGCYQTARGAFLSPNALRVVRATYDKERFEFLLALSTGKDKGDPSALVAAAEAFHACHDEGPRWSFCDESEREKQLQWLRCELAIDEAVLIIGRCETHQRRLWLPLLKEDSPNPNTSLAVWTHAIRTLADAHILDWDRWLEPCLRVAETLGRRDIKAPHAKSPANIFAQAWLSLMPRIADLHHIPMEERLDAWLEIAQLTGAPPAMFTADPEPSPNPMEALRGVEPNFTGLAVPALLGCWAGHHQGAVGPRMRELSAAARANPRRVQYSSAASAGIWREGVRQARTIPSWPYREVWQTSRTFAGFVTAGLTAIMLFFLLACNPSLPFSFGRNTVDKMEDRAFVFAVPSFLSGEGKTVRAGAVSGRQMAEITETALVVHDAPTRVNFGPVVAAPFRDLAPQPELPGFAVLGEKSDLQLISPDFTVTPYFAPAGASVWEGVSPDRILGLGFKAKSSQPRSRIVTVVMEGAGVANYALPDRERNQFLGSWSATEPHAVQQGWVREAFVFTYADSHIRCYDRDTLKLVPGFTSQPTDAVMPNLRRFDAPWSGSPWAAAVTGSNTLFFADSTSGGWRGPFFTTFTTDLTDNSVRAVRVQGQTLWMDAGNKGLVAYVMKQRRLSQLMTDPLCLMEKVPGGVLVAGRSLMLCASADDCKILSPGRVARAAVAPIVESKSLLAKTGVGVVFETRVDNARPLHYLADPADASAVVVHAGHGCPQSSQKSEFTGLVPQPDGRLLVGGDMAPFLYSLKKHAYEGVSRGTAYSARGDGSITEGSARQVSALSVLVGGADGVAGLTKYHVPYYFDGTQWVGLDPEGDTALAVVPPMKAGASFWGLTNRGLRRYGAGGIVRPELFCDGVARSLDSRKEAECSFIGDLIDPADPKQGWEFVQGKEVLTYDSQTGCLQSQTNAPVDLGHVEELRLLKKGQERIWRLAGGRALKQQMNGARPVEKFEFGFTRFPGDPATGLTAIATPPDDLEDVHIVLTGSQGSGIFRYRWTQGSWISVSRAGSKAPATICEFAAPVSGTGVAHDSLNQVWVCTQDKPWAVWSGVSRAAAVGQQLYGLTSNGLRCVTLASSGVDLAETNPVYCRRADVRTALAQASLLWQPAKDALVIVKPDGSLLRYDPKSANANPGMLTGSSGHLRSHAAGTLRYAVHRNRLLAVCPDHLWWFADLENRAVHEATLTSSTDARCAASGENAFIATLGEKGHAVNFYQYAGDTRVSHLQRGAPEDAVPLGETVLAWTEGGDDTLLLATRSGEVIKYAPLTGRTIRLRKSQAGEQLVGWRPAAEGKAGFELLVSQNGECSIWSASVFGAHQLWQFSVDAPNLPGYLQAQLDKAQEALKDQEVRLEESKRDRQSAADAVTRAKERLDELPEKKAKGSSPESEARMNDARDDYARKKETLATADSHLVVAEGEVRRLKAEDAMLNNQRRSFSSNPSLLRTADLQVLSQDQHLLLRLRTDSGEWAELHSGAAGFQEDECSSLEFASANSEPLLGITTSGRLQQWKVAEVHGKKGLLPWFIRQVDPDTRLVRAANGSASAVTNAVLVWPPHHVPNAEVATIEVGEARVTLAGSDAETGFSAKLQVGKDIMEQDALFAGDGSFSWQAVEDLAADGGELYLSTPLGLLARKAEAFTFLSLKRELHDCQLASATGTVLARMPGADPRLVKGSNPALLHQARTGPWEWSQSWLPFCLDNHAGSAVQVNHTKMRDHPRTWTSVDGQWAWNDDVVTGLVRRGSELLCTTQDGVWRMGAEGRAPGDEGLLVGHLIHSAAEMTPDTAQWEESNGHWHWLLPAPSTAEGLLPSRDVNVSPHLALRVTKRQEKLTFASFDQGPVFENGHFFNDVSQQAGMDERGWLFTLTDRRCLLRRDPVHPGMITGAWTVKAALQTAPGATEPLFLDMSHGALWLRLDRTNGSRLVVRMNDVPSGEMFSMGSPENLELRTGALVWQLKHGAASLWEPVSAPLGTKARVALPCSWANDRFAWDQCDSFGFMDDRTLVWQSPAGLVVTRLRPGRPQSEIVVIEPDIKGECEPRRDADGRITGLSVGGKALHFTDGRKVRAFVNDQLAGRMVASVAFAPGNPGGAVVMTENWHDLTVVRSAPRLLTHAIPELKTDQFITQGRFVWDHADSACGDGHGHCITLDGTNVFGNALSADGFELTAAVTLSSPATYARLDESHLYVTDEKGHDLRRANPQCTDWRSLDKVAPDLFLSHEEVRLDAETLSWRTSLHPVWEQDPSPELQTNPRQAPLRLIALESPCKGVKWSFDELDSVTFIQASSPWLILHTHGGVWAGPWHPSAADTFQDSESRLIFTLGSSSRFLPGGPARLRPHAWEGRVELQMPDGHFATWNIGESSFTPSEGPDTKYIGPWSVHDSKLWREGTEVPKTNDFGLPTKTLDDVVELHGNAEIGVWALCSDRTWVKLAR